MKQVYVAAVFLLLAANAFALPPWASSMGIRTPYEKSDFFTGFSMQDKGFNKTQAIEIAKKSALMDLTSSISTTIVSNVNISSREVSGISSTSYSADINVETSHTLSEVEYLFAEDESLVYALALVKKEILQNIYI